MLSEQNRNHSSNSFEILGSPKSQESSSFEDKVQARLDSIEATQSDQFESLKSLILKLSEDQATQIQSIQESKKVIEASERPISEYQHQELISKMDSLKLEVESVKKVDAYASLEKYKKEMEVAHSCIDMMNQDMQAITKHFPILFERAIKYESYQKSSLEWKEKEHDGRRCIDGSLAQKLSKRRPEIIQERLTGPSCKEIQELFTAKIFEFNTRVIALQNQNLRQIQSRPENKKAQNLKQIKQNSLPENSGKESPTFLNISSEQKQKVVKAFNPLFGVPQVNPFKNPIPEKSEEQKSAKPVFNLGKQPSSIFSKPIEFFSPEPVFNFNPSTNIFKKSKKQDNPKQLFQTQRTSLFGETLFEGQSKTIQSNSQNALFGYDTVQNYAKNSKSLFGSEPNTNSEGQFEFKPKKQDSQVKKPIFKPPHQAKFAGKPVKDVIKIEMMKSRPKFVVPYNHIDCSLKTTSKEFKPKFDFSFKSNQKSDLFKTQATLKSRLKYELENPNKD